MRCASPPAAPPRPTAGSKCWRWSSRRISSSGAASRHAFEEEQRLRIEGIVSSSVGEIIDESGVEASIVVRQGEPLKAVREHVGSREEVAALVLGAAPSGPPGPMVAHFTGNDSGKLPCPVMIIPGSLSDERLEQLS